MATRFDMTIAGVDVICRVGTLSINETLNGRNTLTCEILSLDAAYRPAKGAEQIVEDTSVRVFGGNISTPSEHVIDDQLIEEFATTVEAADFNAIADRITVIDGGFPPGFTVKQAATSLVGYLAPYGVTLDAAQVDGPLLPLMTYDIKRVSAWFNEISIITGFVWEIDYNKVLRFIEPGTVAAPFNIADDDGHTVGDIIVEPSDVDYANRVIVLAGEGQREVTEALTFNGTDDFIDLTYSLVGHRGYLTVNAVNETLGGSPAMWIYDPVLNRITREAGAPSAGSGEIIYTAQFPYIAQADDLVAQAGPRGVVDIVIKKTDVFEATLAEALADGYLARLVAEPRRIRYTTFTSGLHPGQTQSIASSVRNISLTVLITDVRARDIDGETMRYEVTAVEGDIYPGSWRDMYRDWGAGGGASSASAGAITVVSSGGVGGSGTVGALAQWVTSSTLGDSILSQSGVTATVAGRLSVSGHSSGGMAIGGDYYPNVLVAVGLNNHPLTAIHQVGVYSALRANSNAAGAGSFNAGFESAVGTQPGSFTIEAVANYHNAYVTKGAGTTITRTWNFSTYDETAGTYNATIAPYDALFTENYFLYYSGTRKSRLAGGDLIAPAELYRSIDTGYMRLAGGATSAGGANLILFGPSHASVPNTVQINGSAGVAITSASTTVSGHLALVGYVSQTTGWRVSDAGEADFRYLFVDEMHAKSFIADLEQALAGGQIIAKSVAMVSQAFTAPAASGTATLWVRDLPSAANMAAFESGDSVVLRTFSRSAGALTIADCVGVVTSYTDGTGANEGQQSWTFTRNAGGSAGTMSASTVVAVDSIVIDYGVSGNGYYEVNAIDGIYGVNSPYAQIVTWTTAPVAANRQVRARYGNLKGITSVLEYGLWAGKSLANNQYLLASDSNFELRGIDLKLYDGSTNTVRIDPTVPSFALGATLPTSYGSTSQPGVWMGKDSGVYKFRVGDMDGDHIAFDGTNIEIEALNLLLSSSLIVNAPSIVFTVDNTGIFTSADMTGLVTTKWYPPATASTTFQNTIYLQVESLARLYTNGGLRVGADIVFAGTNSTGAGAPAFGSNSPATTNSSPYTWIRAISNDGSTVWIPAWK